VTVKSVRLSRRGDPNEGLQDAIIPKAKRQVTTPEQALYGIYGPQYASVLGQSANGSLGETARIGDRIALHNASEEEARRYSADLAAANAAQQKIAETEGYYGIVSDEGKYLQGDVDRGMGGARKVVAGPDGHYGLSIDPTMTQVANANQLNTDQAGRFEKYAGSIDTLRKAGVAIPDNYLGELLTPPTQAERVPVTSSTTPLTPSDETSRYSADEGLTAEQQMEIAQINAAAAKGDDIKYSIKTGEGGVSDVTVTGSPEALIRNGYDPTTGHKVNPSADGQGGGSSAKPAAKNDPTVKPASNAVAVTKQVWPEAVVTSGHRPPNSGVGSNNDYHVRTNAAVDVRPSSLPKGTTFEQFVGKYEAAGYPIIEKIDEVKHPSKHATGPHWHVVLGERRDTSAMYAARFKTSPLVETATPIGDGTVLVTMKDKSQRVYKNGKRVG
jgi:hypothetical protein